MDHQTSPPAPNSSANRLLASLRTSRRLMMAIIGVPMLIMLVVSLFAWPAARMEPRDLPLGLVGPAQATESIGGTLEDQGFDVSRYSDEAAAGEAIEDRDIYGALLLAPDGPTLLTASAASPVVAQLLQEAVNSQFAANGEAPQAPLTFIDVVPAAPNDPRGAVLSASVLPLVLAGMVTGVAMAFVSAPGLPRIYGLLGISVLAGLAVTLVVQSWLEAIEGNWWVNAGVLSLIVLAISSVVAGGASLFGPAGVSIGAVLMLFLGNPWAGIASAPELLPRWVGITGQLLPPGAGGQLLRSAAFFDGAGSWMPLLVLVSWIGIGVAAVWGGAAWHRERATASAIGRPAGSHLTVAR